MTAKRYAYPITRPSSAFDPFLVCTGEHRGPVRSAGGKCGRTARPHQLRQLRQVCEPLVWLPWIVRDVLCPYNVCVQIHGVDGRELGFLALARHSPDLFEGQENRSTERFAVSLETDSIMINDCIGLCVCFIVATFVHRENVVH